MKNYILGFAFLLLAFYLMLQQNPYQNSESEQIVTDYNRSVSKPPTHTVSPENRNDENTTISADNFETVGVLGEENLLEVLETIILALFFPTTQEVSEKLRFMNLGD